MPGRTTLGGRGLTARLALATGSMVLALGLLEAGSRVLGTFEGPLQPLRVGHLELFGRHDPLLFWRLRPEATAPDGTRWINSDGLRGPEVGPTRPTRPRKATG